MAGGTGTWLLLVSGGSCGHLQINASMQEQGFKEHYEASRLAAHSGCQHKDGEKGTKCIVVCFLRDFLLTSGPLDSSLVSEFKIPRLCFLARMQQIGKVSPPL